MAAFFERYPGLVILILLLGITVVIGYDCKHFIALDPVML
jgi:hypothetical protein